MPPAIGQVDACAYTIPTDLPEADGTLAWDSTTVVVAHVIAEGLTGTGWSYTSPGAVPVVETVLRPVLVGRDAFDISAIHEQMVRAVRNLGRAGIAAAAISALDTALWDLKARLLEVPLVSLFGRYRPSVPVYGSGGFTTYDDNTTSKQLTRWVSDDGVSAVKIKVGENWGSRPDRDLHRVGLTRQVIGPHTDLFVDANGGYSAHQAIRIGQKMLDQWRISWYEEPVSSDDLAGMSHVRRHLPLDVAAGEYGYDESYFERMLAADAVDCLQIDATRCGGYTSWLRAAALAAAHNLEVSAHCAPNLHAHVAAATPNLRHVELFHDHTRVDAILFDGVLQPSNGVITPDEDRPGHGLSLKQADAERYRTT